MDEPQQQVGLKRLRGASLLACSCTTHAGRFYKSARKVLTPTFLETTFVKVEDKIAELTAPIVAKAQDAGDKLLHYADSKLDYVLTPAEKVYETGKGNVSQSLSSVLSVHETNMETFKEASQKYFQFVTSSADWVVKTLSPANNLAIAREALSTAIQTAKEASDPDVGVQMATDAWAKFAAHPRVAWALSTAKPIITIGVSSFYSLHDTLVVSSIYKRALELSLYSLGFVSSTTPYRLSVRLFYPMVKPYADPALETVGKSKVVHQVVDYWKPISTV